MYVNFEKACSPDQYAVVCQHEGPILCVAGPGSGKTRTIVYRAAHMIQSGIHAKNLFITSFTRKASHEIVSRTQGLIGPEAKGIAAGTFHSLALRLLRKHYHVLGFESPFTILSQGDSNGLIRELRASLPSTLTHEKNFPNAAEINGSFSYIRNACIDMDESLGVLYPNYADDISTLWERFRLRKKASCVMDYDDILFGLRYILESRPQLCKMYSNKYKYIMVDEFQDTNPIQYDIVLLLTQQHKNILFVGDDAQSIYAFRGADISNILSVQEMFPDITTIKLEENHRSTPQIVSLLNKTLSFATEKLDKTLRSVVGNDTTTEPLFICARDGYSQAQYVIKTIKKLIKHGTAHHEIAVLYRNSHHANIVDMALTKANIPFVRHGGVKFTESQHILDVLAFAKIIFNRFDRIAWKRVLELIPNVGSKTSDKLINQMFDDDDNPLLMSVDDITPWDFLKTYTGKKKYRENINVMGAFIASIFNENDIEMLFKKISDFYQPYLLEKFKKDYEFRLFGIQQLCDTAKDYEDITAFLDDFATDITIENDDECGHVILSTIHSSKAGEWENVFVIELIEGALPSYKNLDDEEELRLFYVACSRAKTGLYLTYPKERKGKNGRIERTVQSRFLKRVREVGLRCG